MNLSFAGCGFLGIYHVGVAVCFKKYAPHLLLDKIGGASAGSLAACCLLCDLPLGHLTNDFFRVVKEARSHSLGPFSPSFNIQSSLLQGLEKHLPADAHLRVSGRLHISLTRVYDGQNVIISQFNSREDVLQALLCACFIPGFSGVLPPRYHGVRYMDGAFSDNLPILDENTVTVSPFCGESDICPRDRSSQIFHINFANTSIEISKQNIYRFRRILFPPNPDVLSKMCQNGFDDALNFLDRNNLINCTRCVAVRSTFVLDEIEQENEGFDPECNECKKHRKDALIGNMPETVLEVFQSYIDSANKGLANWIFKNPAIKILQTLSLPATLPVEILYVTLTKMLRLIPVISSNLIHMAKIFLEELKDIINSRKYISQMYLDSIECGENLQSCRRFSSSLSIVIDEKTDGFKNILGNQYYFGDVDTFEHFLKVTKHHDSIYAYYYMDDINKVQLTEIFDMTEGEILGNDINSQDEYNVQNASEWNASNDLLNRSISEDNLCSSLLDNKNPTAACIGLQIEEVLSDYSDPEADHYITEPMKQSEEAYIPAPAPSNSTTLNIEE